MAQNATIYKVELSISDMDRHYYETHKLTVAKHPSETDERLMVRIIAFALNAHENLEMTKGLSTDDEPDIWQKSLSLVPALVLMTPQFGGNSNIFQEMLAATELLQRKRLRKQRCL